MIFQINQTEYKLGFSFIALITLMLALADSYIVISSVIVSVLHEFGHLFFMYLFKDYPISVQCEAFGMRIEKQLSSNLTYRQEAIISMGGIMVNSILFIISYLCYVGTNQVQFLEFALVNLFIACLNLMPVELLDAGRFLKYMCLIYLSVDKTQNIIEKISFITVALFGFFTLWYTLFIAVNFSLIIVFIYLLIIDRKWR